MDAYGFIAALVSSLAWPIVVLIAVLILRQPIAALLGRAEKGKLGASGLELSFTKQVEALRDSVEADLVAVPTKEKQIAAEPSAATSPTLALPAPDFHALTDELGRTSATGSIIATWAEFEAGLQALAKTLGLSWRPANIARNISDLIDTGIFSERQKSDIRELRRLRNEAAHPKNAALPTLTDAEVYREAAQALLSELKLNASNLQWR